MANGSLQDQRYRPLPERLLGMPQVVCTSEQTLPIVLGLREFQCQKCIVLETQAIPMGGIQAILLRLSPGVQVLNVQAQRQFLLSPIDAGANERMAGEMLDFAAQAGLTRFLWNYTPGTKQIFLGLYRGFFHKVPSACSCSGMYYLDTSGADSLLIDGEASGRPLLCRLDAGEIILANGWGVDAAIVLRKMKARQVSRSLQNSGAILEWLRCTGAEYKLVGNAKYLSGGPGDWLSLEIAAGLLNRGHAEEVWLAVKARPLQSAGQSDGSQQDLDLVYAVNNTLVVLECKWTNAQPQAVLQLAQLARKVGGRKAVAVLARKPPHGGTGQVAGTKTKGDAHQVEVIFYDPKSTEPFFTALKKRCQVPLIG